MQNIIGKRSDWNGGFRFLDFRVDCFDFLSNNMNQISTWSWLLHVFPVGADTEVVCFLLTWRWRRNGKTVLRSFWTNKNLDDHPTWQATIYISNDPTDSYELGSHGRPF